MNKILSKTVKKATLLSIILAVILVAGIVLGAVFGFNKALTVKNYSTLIVSMDNAENQREETIKDICDGALKDQAISCRIEGNGQNIQIIYVFNGMYGLQAEKQAVENAIDLAKDTSLQGAINDISVITGQEKVQTYLAKGYALRGIIAAAVFAVLAFAYVTLRYKLRMGILATVCAVLGGGLTAAVLAIVRIPVTASVIYTIAFGVILSTVTTMLTLNKLRENEKKDEDVEATVLSSIAVKEISLLCIAMAVTIVLVGAIATTAVRWFAVSALVSVLVSAVIGLIYAPALYLPLKKFADKKAAERARYDYKKGAKKSAKTKVEEKTEEVVAD